MVDAPIRLLAFGFYPPIGAVSRFKAQIELYEKRCGTTANKRMIANVVRKVRNLADGSSAPIRVGFDAPVMLEAVAGMRYIVDAHITVC